MKVPLEDIKLATNNFGEKNFIARGGFGNVFTGKLSVSGRDVAVKRLDTTQGQGNQEFLVEIQMLSCYKHENVVTLVGFCEENGEKIILYEYVKHGSLDRYISSANLSWFQRLKISIGAACGISYLHNDVGPQHRVLHRDIKSSNILLNENWEAKISDFGLSKIGPSNVEYTFLVTNACGTFGYVDPQYVKTGILTKESDVYSFGMVLFEILCGRLQDERRFLAFFAQRACEENRLYDIIFPGIKDEIKVIFDFDEEIVGIDGTQGSDTIISSLSFVTNKRMHGPFGRATNSVFSIPLEKGSLGGFYGIAGDRIDGIGVYVKANDDITRIGTWGTSNPGGPQNIWNFKLETDHHLNKITIEHGDLIYSLMFTTQYRGLNHTSQKAGGWNTGDMGAFGWTDGDIVYEVTFEWDEEINAIKGTVAKSSGPYAGYTIISSVSFVTNKKTYGPFGKVRGTPFRVAWDDGSFAGFYGLCGYYIDSIGVYLKATI